MLVTKAIFPLEKWVILNEQIAEVYIELKLNKHCKIELENFLISFRI